MKTYKEFVVEANKNDKKTLMDKLKDAAKEAAKGAFKIPGNAGKAVQV